MSVSNDVNVGAQLAEVSDGRGASGLIRYGVDAKIGWGPSLLFGVQHVLIMFGAMLAAPLIVSQALGLSADLRATMIGGVMFGCGIGTLISALGLWGVGGRLPLLLGAYTAYVGPVISISRAEGLGAASAAMLIGGVVLLVASPLMGRLKVLFPPVVVGTLLVVTGMTLAKIAGGIAFAANTPFAGSPLTLGFLLMSTVIIAALAALRTGLIGSLSVSIAVVAVYGAAYAAGIGNFDAVANAAWFRSPRLLPYGLAWPSAASVATVAIYYLVAAVYTMSVTLALCAMTGISDTARRVRGAVAADGLGSAVAVLFGGVPLISYDQNVGAVSLTGVASRYVVAVSGALLAVGAFVPKIAAAVGSVPPFVLGGVLIFMFATIVAVGIRILVDAGRQRRDFVIVAASFGLSAAVNFAPPGALDMVPAAVRVLAGDGIIVGTLAAVLLSACLPGRATGAS